MVGAGGAMVDAGELNTTAGVSLSCAILNNRAPECLGYLLTECSVRQPSNSVWMVGVKDLPGMDVQDTKATIESTLLQRYGECLIPPKETLKYTFKLLRVSVAP